MDIDFIVPKPIIAPARRGADIDNDCKIIQDSKESTHKSTKKSIVTYPNMSEPMEDQKTLFYSKIAKYKPSILSLA